MKTRKKHSPATITKDRKRTKLWFRKNPEYQSWAAMMSRCFRRADRCWRTYGGAGVTVCPRWANPETGYLAFVQDMGERPSKKHSLGRFMDMGGYACGQCANCRKKGLSRNGEWQTRSEQAQNRRKKTQLRRLIEGTHSVLTGRPLKTLVQAA